MVEQVDARNVKRCIINNLNKFHITEELESNQLQALIKALDAKLNYLLIMKITLILSWINQQRRILILLLNQ